MSDQDALPGVDENTIAPVEIGGTENFHSPSSAARALANYRYEKLKKEQPEADDAPPATESAQADAEPPTETIGETKADEAVTPIDPPGSWTREAKERWQALPRETQEYLVERERQREREFTKGQQEAAEARKAIEAERAKVEQARLQYETALPQLLQTLQAQYAGAFPDVKTMADVERLAAEDWPRYVQWDLQQKKMAAVQQEFLAAQQREQGEKQSKFSEFARKQDELFKERVPDIADPKKSAELEKAALKTLSNLGFEQSELGASWTGQKDISLRDHRMQLLIRDATLWREAQEKAKATAAKPLPPVQRPGVAKSPGAQAEAETQALTQRLAQTGSLRDAIALRKAQVAAR